jgi:hypothetical protein
MDRTTRVCRQHLRNISVARRALPRQLKRADISTALAFYLRHTSHRVGNHTILPKHHLVTMAQMLDQAQTMHAQSTYAQIPSDEDAWRAEFFKNMQTEIEARKREVADIDEMFLQHRPQHSVDFRAANEGLMVLLSVILFRLVIYKTFIRLGAGGSLAVVLAFSLIPPAAMLVET